MKHFLSIESETAEHLVALLESSVQFKANRGKASESLLDGQTWALLFSKPSTRTRVSFEVGIRELGGAVIFLSRGDIQLGRGEPIIDTARVLGRMVQGAVIRTFAQSDIEQFAEYSQIPTINALTDYEHPCQIMADLLTILEKRGSLDDLKVCFIGDGKNNVAYSWIWAAERLGFELRIAAPDSYRPADSILEKMTNSRIFVTDDPLAGADQADVLYTDVWVSMGFEEESARRLAELDAFQINEPLVARAAPKALVLHCLPAYRGREISAETLEKHAATIFDQAENRLHVQKAILSDVRK
ncbi:MAG: ornithine carbamoyltransferase [Verrucomicrobia bacterium]|nr:ornithine carbamoyltransferase [Verrucomicrobiota bacterium]MBV9643280.1 ornithine carbamoyltransferase [Verrucomicrobiota bacterium]